MITEHERAKIDKMLHDYDDGVISLDGLRTLIVAMLDDVDQRAYGDGYEDARTEDDEDFEDEEVEFEAEVDLDEFREDVDGDQ